MDNEGIENIREALIYAGFSSKEADKQINDLGRLVGLKIVENIVTLYPDIDINENNFNDFVSSHKDDPKIILARDKASAEVTQAYFQTIAAKLTSEKKNKFLTILGK